MRQREAHEENHACVYREDRAGHFLSMDEAHRVAQGRGYREGSYDVLAVDVDVHKLIRQ